MHGDSQVSGMLKTAKTVFIILNDAFGKTKQRNIYARPGVPELAQQAKAGRGFAGK
jgi:hypothetical protein